MKNQDDNEDGKWDRVKHSMGHAAMHYGHMAYFAAVAAEGHGLYAILAGCLFCLAVLNQIFHFE